MMRACDFLFRIENIIKKAANFPWNWDEDCITRSLLKSMLEIFGTRIEIYLDEPFSFLPINMSFPSGYAQQVIVEWEAYKMSGRDENKFGDVAILVAIKYHDGDKVEGVAFLEAKKIYENTHNFEAMDFDQLKRIIEHAPKASVLLYDFDPIIYRHFCDFDSIYSYRRFYSHRRFYLHRRYQSGWRTHAVTVPIDLVIAKQKKDRSLYKFSMPFSVQLMMHLLGFCLHHDDEPITIARGYQKKYRDQEKYPLYLLVARVGIGERPPSIDEVEFNRKRAQPL